METKEPKVKKAITIESLIHAPVEKVWEYWNEPKHITQWCHATDDWHAPKAENDLRVGGHFTTTMAAKDGSVSFDFTGTYSEIQQHEKIVYTIADGRKVEIVFKQEGDSTHVTEKFEPENENPVEMQQDGWQSILDNFKKYAEQSK